MELTKKQIGNWAEFLHDDNVRILVDKNNYNLTKETRLLIPFHKNGKFGLINQEGVIVADAIYDSILDECHNERDLIRVGKMHPYGFIEGNRVKSYAKNRYGIIDSKGKILFDLLYYRIVISTDKKILTLQDSDKGYAVFDRDGNEIIPFGKYGWIDGFDKGLARFAGPKYGIINDKGEVVLQPEFDEIWNFYKKNKTHTKTVKNGVEKDVNLMMLNNNNNLKRCEKETNDFITYDDNYGTHYGQFAGSYAQDVMGYSDDVINDAFEGDPDMYWNID